MNDGHDDVVAGPDAERAQGDRDRLGAVGDADRVVDAEVARRTPCSKAADLRAEDEAPASRAPSSSASRRRRRSGLERRRRVEERDGHGGHPSTEADRLPWAVVTAALLVLASVTDTLATFATNVVGDLGLPGIFLLMVPESACIPIPSEATMLFAGFNVYEGEYSLWAAVAVGSAANLVGSWIAYAVGYLRAHRAAREARPKFLHIKPSHLAWADRWFERYGAPTVFFSRMLPIIRTFISLPAGVARMPFWQFTRADARRAACRGSSCSRSSASRSATTGTSWKDYLHYVDYAVAALIVVGRRRTSSCRWRRSRDRGRAADVRRPERRAPELRHALALGVLHGPAELLPDLLLGAHRRSSRGCSAGPTPTLDGELRKAFEVALHAGTAAALLVGLRDEVARGGARARPPPRRAPRWARSCRRRSSGYTLERPIERAPGHAADHRRRPAAGAAAMALADRAARRAAGARRPAPPTRSRSASRRPARSSPGVSRNGVTLAAARAARLRPRGRERALAPRRAAGHRRGDRAEGRAAGAARRAAPSWRAPSPPAWAPPSPRRWPRCGSSARSSATGRSLPYAAYRAALAAVVLRRAWQNRAR